MQRCMADSLLSNFLNLLGSSIPAVIIANISSILSQCLSYQGYSWFDCYALCNCSIGVDDESNKIDKSSVVCIFPVHLISHSSVSQEFHLLLIKLSSCLNSTILLCIYKCLHLTHITPVYSGCRGEASFCFNRKVYFCISASSVSFSAACSRSPIDGLLQLSMLSLAEEYTAIVPNEKMAVFCYKSHLGT